ncbi:PA2778 family cysteine peptidase [Halopseudomonas pelagia]|uniref:PA2778 family cysteine peptidase n=1 Tax=Halopseudomonas pelagia TaxID=553151 RepID=UPI0003B3C11A|nr:PA2778 family cysteine peptidase [Halopseudomonas pelagia]
MRCLTHLFVLLGLAALLSACAGRPTALPSPESLSNLPSSTYLDQVPFHAQDAYQCGPAALAMILNHRGLPDTPDELVGRVYIPERKGTLQVELVSASRERDLLVYPVARQLEAVMTELDAGNPVLVMQNLAFNWFPQWHYAVVVGYDLEQREMIVHSGLNKAQREPFKVFMRTWDRADRWARVMLPAHQLPATAEPLVYLRAASDLEQTGRLDSARQAYATALSTWPEQPTARFGLGNVAWAQQQPEISVEHFRTLVTDFPDFKPGWNNLSVALEAIGCAQSAAAAKACAADDAATEAATPEDAALDLDKNAPETGRCAIPRCTDRAPTQSD